MRGETQSEGNGERARILWVAGGKLEQYRDGVKITLTLKGRGRQAIIASHRGVRGRVREIWHMSNRLSYRSLNCAAQQATPMMPALSPSWDGTIST